MAKKVRLEVNDVWILEEVLPYEGSTILGVFYDPEVAKDARPDVKRWYTPATDQTSLCSVAEPMSTYEAFYYISKHSVRTK
jgi:hypothetical protein